MLFLWTRFSFDLNIVQALLPVMTQGLHVHIHRAGIRTRCPLKETENRHMDGCTGSDPSMPACQGHAGLTYLQTDGQVNPGAKSSADSSGGQAHILKQLREGMCEGEARPLLRYHHAAPHTRQVHSAGLKHQHTRTTSLTPGAIFCCLSGCSQHGLYSGTYFYLWQPKLLISHPHRSSQTSASSLYLWGHCQH